MCCQPKRIPTLGAEDLMLRLLTDQPLLQQLTATSLPYSFILQAPQYG